MAGDQCAGGPALSLARHLLVHLGRSRSNWWCTLGRREQLVVHPETETGLFWSQIAPGVAAQVPDCTTSCSSSPNLHHQLVQGDRLESQVAPPVEAHVPICTSSCATMSCAEPPVAARHERGSQPAPPVAARHERGCQPAPSAVAATCFACSCTSPRPFAPCAPHVRGNRACAWPPLPARIIHTNHEGEQHAASARESGT